jgi:hypothetical protein
MAWECNGLFSAITNAAEMMNDMPFHNGIVEQADFRLIRPVPRQSSLLVKKELI